MEGRARVEQDRDKVQAVFDRAVAANSTEMQSDKVLPHAVIKHAQWYVDGTIHTNTIEGFWALLKRGMFGQFHSVSRKYLQRYVDEFCYRYNLRGVEPDHMFALTIDRGLGVAA